MWTQHPFFRSYILEFQGLKPLNCKPYNNTQYPRNVLREGACLCVVHQPRSKPLHLLNGCDSAERNLPKVLVVEGAVGYSPQHLRISTLQPSAQHNHSTLNARD